MIGHVLEKHALEGPDIRYEPGGVRFALAALAVPAAHNTGDKP